MTDSKKMQDLRAWLKKIEEIGQLKQLKGVDWNLEMGGPHGGKYDAKRPRSPF